MIIFTAPTIAGSIILRVAFLIACMLAAGFVITIDAGF